MKAAVPLLAGLLPFQAWAQQPVELTLNCQYERLYDLTAGTAERMTGNFSAIVRIDDSSSTATIEATTPACRNYLDDAVTKLQVMGLCKNEGHRYMLTIDRIGGAFSYIGLLGGSDVIHQGHCTPRKVF